jgi:hypothetical protein
MGSPTGIMPSCEAEFLVRFRFWPARFRERDQKNGHAHTIPT